MIVVKTLRNWDKKRMRFGGYDWKIISCIQTHASRINYLLPCKPFAAKGIDKLPLLMERRLTKGGFALGKQHFSERNLFYGNSDVDKPTPIICFSQSKYSITFYVTLIN